MTRPHHQNPALVAVVAVGGMVGTAARYALSTAVPTGRGWPVATFTANVVGSFVLGVLLESLVRRGPESSRGRLVRLGVGTGVLGGFTTFSSLALDTERLLSDGSVLGAASYAVASLGCGFLVCLGGVVMAARHHARRIERADRGRRASASAESVRPLPGEGSRS